MRREGNFGRRIMPALSRTSAPMGCASQSCYLTVKFSMTATAITHGLGRRNSRRVGPDCQGKRRAVAGAPEAMLKKAVNGDRKRLMEGLANYALRNNEALPLILNMPLFIAAVEKGAEN